MKKSISLPFMILSLVILVSCDIKKSNIAPEASFVKVFESTNIDEAYYPEDILQTAENYLILSALKDSSLTNFPKISISLLNSTGDVDVSVFLPDNLVNPVHGWLNFNGQIFFVCMDDITLQAKLLEISISDNSVHYEETMQFDRKMPLYAWSDQSGILLLSYDRIGRNSVIDKYDIDLNPVWSVSTATKEDFEQAVWQHFERTGKIFPFFVGSVDNESLQPDYFVNCLDNYSMAMLFVQGASGSITGKLFSYQEETAVSSAISLHTDSFAISRYHSGDNYIYPKVNLDMNALQNTNEFQDILISQLQPDARMDVLKYRPYETDYILFASTTKNNQITLMFFNATNGQLTYAHTLGYGNPVEVVAILQTNDQGLAVLGKTWINGQYQRIILYKVAKDQLSLE